LFDGLAALELELICNPDTAMIRHWLRPYSADGAQPNNRPGTVSLSSCSGCRQSRIGQWL